MGKQVDGLGPMGGDHHAHARVLDGLDERLVHNVRGLGVQGARGLVRQEEQRVARQLPGQDRSLLLPSRQVAGDVHCAVGHVDHLQELYGPLHLLLVRHALDDLEDVLYDGKVPVEGEGPLQHDGDAPAHGQAQGVPLVHGPEIDLGDLRFLSALGALGPRRWQIEPSAGGAMIHPVDDAP